MFGSKKTILCIGSASQDVFMPTKEGRIMRTPKDLQAQFKIAFEYGAKFHIEKRYEALGGCAANVASGLTKLGERAACYCLVGVDRIGAWIRVQLKSIGISTQLVQEIPKTASDLSLIVVDSDSGGRIIFSNQEANRHLEVKVGKLKGYEWIFVGDLNGDWRSNLHAIAAASQKYAIKLAYNPRQQNIHQDPAQILKFLKNVEILFVNKDEALELAYSVGKTAAAKLKNESYLLEFLRKYGPRIVVITDDVRGAWACDRKHVYHAAALTKKAVDTTGAGDAFAAGFFAAVLKGADIQGALRWGAANAASSLSEYGGGAGQLTLKDIDKWARRVKLKLVK